MHLDVSLIPASISHLVDTYQLADSLHVQAPKASENFRCLCTGEKGIGKASKKLLHYKASLCILHTHTLTSVQSHAPYILA